ncbi:YafY family transcriptional regulator [Sphingobacterium sp. SGG-5]|uniref:helix-turn-helix transcriptional regulator n=1 Tax=Sphingobacterium sp. SGG-5 TaxID=2710881 RepID=UPI0013E99F11|nr:YafY family protein [Sphingobacterium sp. SGG-5]NGM61282.1 YafY family transcriptional regulator [Sphingobacterium sp. SGG-5]
MDIEKRFDRILAIYFHLQAKPVVKAQDLADKFQVSLRTIYRDVKTLENAGVPIYGEAGIGYSLISDYKIPPTLFTPNEALSFAVAEKLMQHYLDKEIGQHFSNALLKMKAVLRYSDKEHLAHVEDKVLINKKKDFLNKDVPSALAVLFEGIAKKRQLTLAYKSVESTVVTERRIEPIGIFQEDDFWYFMAFCHRRNEVRQFRLDRVHKIELSGTPFVGKYKPLSFYLEKKGDTTEVQTVRISVSRKAARYLTWKRKYYGFIEEMEKGENVEMLFKTRNAHGEFARWFLMYADEAVILEPLALKKQVRALLDAYLKKMEAE